MRNICISQRQLKFVTKRLTDDEKSELMHILTKVNGGYQITWVAESINKRREYSESRRKNRKGNSKKHMNNISKTYVPHMENENENEDVSKKEREIEKIIFPFNSSEFKKAWSIWKEYKKEQFGFKYKGTYSEQGALTKLSKLADNEKTANAIIMQSIENGWKGFFELKDKRNGKQSNSFDLNEFWVDYCKSRGVV